MVILHHSRLSIHGVSSCGPTPGVLRYWSFCSDICPIIMGMFGMLAGTDVHYATFHFAFVVFPEIFFYISPFLHSILDHIFLQLGLSPEFHLQTTTHFPRPMLIPIGALHLNIRIFVLLMGNY